MDDTTNPPAQPDDRAIADREAPSEARVSASTNPLDKYDDIARKTGNRRCFQKHAGDVGVQCERDAGHSMEADEDGGHVFVVNGEVVVTV